MWLLTSSKQMYCGNVILLYQLHQKRPRLYQFKHSELEEWEDAVGAYETLNKILEVEQDKVKFASLHIRWGQVLNKLNKHQEALTHFDKVMKTANIASFLTCIIRLLVLRPRTSQRF